MPQDDLPLIGSVPLRDIERVVEEEDLAPDPMLVVCPGPPLCDCTHEQAIQRQLAGCLWCTRIILHYDGSETVIEPGQC